MLYRDIINPYPPFLSYFLAIFSKIFGYQPPPYQILTWGIILLTDMVIFLTAKNIFKKTSIAVTSAFFFAIFSIPFSINGLWFDLVQTPFIIISFYYLYKFLIVKKFAKTDIFISIFFLTISFFIKQQVLWLIFWFLIILVFRFGKKVKNILTENIYILAPFAVLLILQVLFFWQKDTHGDFLFWNFYFPFFKASKMPGYILLPTIRQLLVLVTLFLFFVPSLVQRKFETRLIVVTAFVLILFAYPRFDYFHLIPALSILSLAAGKNFKVLFKSTKLIQTISVISFLFLIAFIVRYTIRNWSAEVRFFEADIISSAKFLKRITTPSETIYIQNGPDQLLPLAERLPTKPWAIQFPWYLEIEQTQKRVLEGLTSQEPRFIIYKPYDPSVRFETGGYRPKEIADYIDANYQNKIQMSDTLWLKVQR